jgi:hypothetical protein
MAPGQTQRISGITPVFDLVNVQVNSFASVPFVLFRPETL